MKIETIVNELEYIFGDSLEEYLGNSIQKCDENFIKRKFNEYATLNMQKIKIKDLIDNYKDTAFLVNTPDGFQEIGDFYIKPEIDLLEIVTAEKYKTKCSIEHKFETSVGWKFAKDISKKDLILTKNGFRKVKFINKFDKEKVYDFEVLHDNHRYWSGNGLSSHNSGKTFIALSIIRNAINKHAYQAIYMDSEGSIDKTFVERLGVDTSKMRLQLVNTIEEVNYIASQIIQQFENNEKAGLSNPKVIIALDSLGNLSSQKESTDSVEGNDKRDMTKQQAIRKLFRVNGMKFAKYGIPFIVNAHVYEKIGSYIPGKEVSGGGGLKYNVSIMLMLSKKRMEDKESEEHVKAHGIDATRIGVTIKVTPIKQRFAKPIIVELHIPFYKAPNPFVGLEKFVSWDACGVLRGKMLNEKDYLKLTPAEQKISKKFEIIVDKKLSSTEYSNLSKEELKLVFLDPSTNAKYIKQTEIRYALPKDTARTLVCKHLGGELPITDLFTDKVFTDEVLHLLDDNIIKPTFQLPHMETLEDLSELTNDFIDELDQINIEE